MKKIMTALAASLLVSTASWATDVSGTQNYRGPIGPVAFGFYGQAAVELPDGWTCHGQKEVLLMTSNARYNEIVAMLMTAHATREHVSFYRLAANSDYYGYCTIDSAALGDLNAWPS